MPIPTAIPQDMRDLLIRLDQRVDDGFKNITTKLDDMNRRADGHESRIRALEDRFQQLEGAGKGAGYFGKGLSALAGAGVAALAIFGLHIQAVPKDQVKARTTVEHTQTLPVR